MALGKLGGIERPPDVVRVEVREDHARNVPGGKARFVHVVEKVLLPPQFVAAFEHLGQLGTESGVDEHEVVIGLDEDGVHGTLDARLARAAEEVTGVRDEHPVVQYVHAHPSYVQALPRSQVVQPSSNREPA